MEKKKATETQSLFAKFKNIFSTSENNQEKIKQLKESIDVLLNLSQENEKNEEEKKRKIEELNKNNNFLKDENEKERKKFIIFNDEFNKIKKEIIQKENYITFLNKNQSEISDTFKRQKDDFERKIAENSKNLNEKNLELKNKNTFFEESQKKLIKELEKKNEEKENLKEKCQQLNNKIAEMMGLIEPSFQKKYENSNNFEQNLKIIQKLKENIEKKNENSNEYEENLKKKKKKMKKEIQEKNEEISELKIKLNKIKKKYTLSKEKNEMLQKDYDIVTQKYIELQQEHRKGKNTIFASKNSEISSIINIPYDIIINIDSLKTKKFGWEVEINPNLKRKIETMNKNVSIIGLVGRENIGKTFILNKICGFDLPSGTNLNTKGLSLKYSNNRNVLCLDSAGIQTPVYYYDEKLMQRFSIGKENLKRDDEIKRQMINDRTLTDIFIQDFILEVCEVIVIVVGQLSQNDQKFIERISMKYKSKKRIIILHNFMNLNSVEDIDNKIEKDIFLAFDPIQKGIPDSDLIEYIEKNPDSKRENISHLILGAENFESGDKFNNNTFKYLRDILDTRLDKKTFDLVGELTRFFEENYRLYLQFKQKSEQKITLKYEEKASCLKILSEFDYEISNPLFNSLGNLVTNPPFEVFEKENRYIVLIELPDLEANSLKLSIDKKKTEFNCLIINGRKKSEQIMNETDVFGTRNHGEFSCVIPLGNNFIKLRVLGKLTKYEFGVLRVEIDIIEEKEINL